METASKDGVGRETQTSTPLTPGRRRLTPQELHEQRVRWGKEWGRAMTEIRQAHEKRGR